MFAPTVIGSSALAQSSAASWPNRPVRIIIPFTPGGGADMMLTEMKDQELLKLVALDLAAAMKEG